MKDIKLKFKVGDRVSWTYKLWENIKPCGMCGHSTKGGKYFDIPVTGIIMKIDVHLEDQGEGFKLAYALFMAEIDERFGSGDGDVGGFIDHDTQYGEAWGGSEEMKSDPKFKLTGE